MSLGPKKEERQSRKFTERAGLSPPARGLASHLCGCLLVTKSCLTLCDPMDCSPPASSVHGILQARTLEWGAIPFSKGSSLPRDRTCVFCMCSWVLYHLSILRARGGLHNIWGRKWMLEEESLMQKRKCKNFPESGEWAVPRQQPRGGARWLCGENL